MAGTVRIGIGADGAVGNVPDSIDDRSEGRWLRHESRRGWVGCDAHRARSIPHPHRTATSIDHPSLALQAPYFLPQPPDFCKKHPSLLFPCLRLEIALDRRPRQQLRLETFIVRLQCPSDLLQPNVGVNLIVFELTDTLLQSGDVVGTASAMGSLGLPVLRLARLRISKNPNERRSSSHYLAPRQQPSAPASLSPATPTPCSASQIPSQRMSSYLCQERGTPHWMLRGWRMMWRPWRPW